MKTFDLNELPRPSNAVRDTDIAIIGIAARFPGAGNAEMFWQNIVSGVASIRFFSDAELAAAGVTPAALADPSYVKAASVLDADAGLFDAEFFGFTPREAELTDPQQRLLLECAHEAFEDAGYVPCSSDGKIGVFAGVGTSTYLLNGLGACLREADPVKAFQILHSNEKDYAPTRISYKLGLTGPSVCVSSACSSGLVAAHLACRSLLDYECDMALAGAANVHVPQVRGYQYYEGGISSPDGHCRPFDADAGGTVVNGSGVGVLLLKRVPEALAAGDHIYAVIKGSAVNNDGQTKLGYTAPSFAGQVDVVREAIAVAGIDPRTIGYVEANGIGTPIADAIEIAALTEAFGAYTTDKEFCAVGAVKPNVGHLDTASAMAALIKAAFALKHGSIPPTLSFTTPSPRIDFKHSPFYVNATVNEWRSAAGPRRAGVSAFGLGGTNAHLILEEAPPPPTRKAARPFELVLVSANSETTLELAIGQLGDYLERHPGLVLRDVAHTLRVGRKGRRHRAAVVCRDLADAVAALRTRAPSRLLHAVADGETPRVVFVFSGQSAAPARTRAYLSEPAFCAAVERCSELLRPWLDLDIRSVLYPDAQGTDEAARLLARPDINAAAVFIVDYASAMLWRSWGVEPDIVLGQGAGEYVAACVAGVFDLADAVRLTVARGQVLVQSPPPASAPDRAATPFAACLAGTRPAAPRITLISGVTGRRLTTEQACDPAYWLQQLSAPVRFADAVDTARAEGAVAMLEIGPTQTGTPFAVPGALPMLASTPGADDDLAALLTTAARVWLAGIDLDWDALDSHADTRRVSLPTYPFQRQRYWVDTPTPEGRDRAPHELTRGLAACLGENGGGQLDWSSAITRANKQKRAFGAFRQARQKGVE